MMFTQVSNLVFAALGAFIAILVLVDKSASWDGMSLVLALVTFCWLGSAIGLFFRSRLAWCGSLLGVGVMLSGAIMMVVVGRALLPAAQDPTDGIGMAIVAGFLGLLISVPILIGLLRLRRRWFCPAASVPNEALQATAAPPRI